MGSIWIVHLFKDVLDGLPPFLPAVCLVKESQAVESDLGAGLHPPHLPRPHTGSEGRRQRLTVGEEFIFMGACVHFVSRARLRMAGRNKKTSRFFLSEWDETKRGYVFLHVFI
jgi:hypothetical protein